MSNLSNNEPLEAIEIPPINSRTLKCSSNANVVNVQKEETAEIKVEKSENPKESQEDTEFKNLVKEILDDDIVEGILEPSESEPGEKKKVEEPPVKNEKKTRKDPPKTVKETVEVKQTKKKVNTKKDGPSETPEEQENRLIKEFINELNEGYEVGILQPSPSPLSSRSSSKVSEKKETAQRASKKPLKK